MIHIIQLLCPQRHCIAAVAYDEKDTAASAIAALQENLAHVHANPWCGICGSVYLKFEERLTPFNTMKEAEEVIRQLLVANLATRQMLDDAGLTYDKQKLN